MHENDPEETAADETMGRRDATAADKSMDPNQASDQSAAPVTDVMGERGDMAPDPMGAPIPEPDETLGDRREGNRP